MNLRSRHGMPRGGCNGGLSGTGRWSLAWGVLLWSMAAGLLRAAPAPLELSEAQRRALGVEFVPVQPATESTSTPFPARVVVPNDQLRVVSTPLSGLLESLRVAEGQRVRRGDLLAVVRSPDLLEAQRTYLDALNRYELAESNYRRDRQLYKEGIIAERRYLESRARYQQAKTDLQQSRQILELAGMGPEALERLAKIRRLSGRLEIRSPLDGVVLKQMATPGQRLEALDPIYTVGRLRPLWLEIHVPLNRLRGVAPGSRVRVVEPAVEARVITVGRMVHTEDQGVLVRAAVREGSERLFPGQFVKVELSRPRPAGGLRVPRGALVRHGGRAWVFVAGDGGRIVPVPVEVVAEEPRSVVVRGELRPDDRVVAHGTSALKAIWLEAAD